MSEWNRARALGLPIDAASALNLTQCAHHSQKSNQAECRQNSGTCSVYPLSHFTLIPLLFSQFLLRCLPQSPPNFLLENETIVYLAITLSVRIICTAEDLFLLSPPANSSTMDMRSIWLILSLRASIFSTHMKPIVSHHFFPALSLSS